MRAKSISLAPATALLVFLLSTCTNDSTSEKRFYYSDGTLKKVIAKKKGKWDGVTLTYYPNGQLKSKSSWRNDVQHGPALFYNISGNLEEITNWYNGKQQGTSLWYHRNGTLERKAYLQAGVKVGNVIFFDSCGKPEELQVYDKKGRLIRVTDYNQQGKPRLGGGYLLFMPRTPLSGEKVIPAMLILAIHRRVPLPCLLAA